MAQRLEALFHLTLSDLEVVDVPEGERARLLPIIEESFEGLYLWHARRTLQNIETVRAARTPEGDEAGLLMMKMLGDGAGYVYYVAVARRWRKMGVGGRLLDDAVSYLAKGGAKDIFASVEEENEDSKGLFGSRGFERVDMSEMAGMYGRLRALLMYREMMVVPGEVLLRKRVS
jgi:ribosomal protein S18 acetylase RimI-like enzyme